MRRTTVTAWRRGASASRRIHTATALPISRLAGKAAHQPSPVSHSDTAALAVLPAIAASSNWPPRPGRSARAS